MKPGIFFVHPKIFHFNKSAFIFSKIAYFNIIHNAYLLRENKMKN